MAEERVALVTGASSGIGKGIALRFAQGGWKVGVNARRQHLLQDLIKEIEELGSEAVKLPDNLTEFGSHERVINDTIDAFGRIDCLVNNAGSGTYEYIDELTDEVWDDTFKLNVWAPAAMVRAITPHYKAAGGGQIINIGSIVGYVGVPRGTSYAGSKWALRGMNECWRKELYPHNVKVAYVGPGFVLSEFGGRPKERNEAAKEWAMVPEDVAHVVYCIATQGPNSDIKEVAVEVLDRS